MEDNDIKESIKTIIDTLTKDAKWYDYTCLTSQEDLMVQIFENYFEEVEGFSCCCDKARYVTRKLLESIKNKETYSLRMTYRESVHKDRFSEEELDKVCYWCPITIVNTEDAYNVFCRMIKPKHVTKLIEEKTKLRIDRIGDTELY